MFLICSYVEVLKRITVGLLLLGVLLNLGSCAKNPNYSEIWDVSALTEVEKQTLRKEVEVFTSLNSLNAGADWSGGPCSVVPKEFSDFIESKDLKEAYSQFSLWFSGDNVGYNGLINRATNVAQYLKERRGMLVYSLRQDELSEEQILGITKEIRSIEYKVVLLDKFLDSMREYLEQAFNDDNARFKKSLASSFASSIERAFAKVEALPNDIPSWYKLMSFEDSYFHLARSTAASLLKDDCEAHLESLTNSAGITHAGGIQQYKRHYYDDSFDDHVRNIYSEARKSFGWERPLADSPIYKKATEFLSDSGSDFYKMVIDGSEDVYELGSYYYQKPFLARSHFTRKAFFTSDDYNKKFKEFQQYEERQYSQAMMVTEKAKSGGYKGWSWMKASGDVHSMANEGLYKATPGGKFLIACDERSSSKMWLYVELDGDASGYPGLYVDDVLYKYDDGSVGLDRSLKGFINFLSNAGSLNLRYTHIGISPSYYPIYWHPTKGVIKQEPPADHKLYKALRQSSGSKIEVKFYKKGYGNVYMPEAKEILRTMSYVCRGEPFQSRYGYVGELKHFNENKK